MTEKMGGSKANKANYIGADDDAGFSNPMLEKVKNLLISTEPERWRIGGADLTPESRFSRPRTSYDQVLVRDIPNGSLVLHASQAVTSQYLPGGYALTPAAAPTYTIEVRDKIFDAEKVVDPRYADNQKGKRCDIIATGDIAKTLFLQVQSTVKTFRQEKSSSFEERARELLNTIVERISETRIEDWERAKERTREEEDVVRFTSQLEGLQVEIIKAVKNWESSYRLILHQDSFVYERAPRSLALACFKKLEELDQNAQLSALSDRLKDLGLE